VCAAACICNPFDILEVDKQMEGFNFGIYHRVMGKNKVKTMLKQKPEILAGLEASAPGTIKELVKITKTARDFDRYFIAPTFGFKTPEALYKHISCIHRLASIKVPTFFLSSLNDPVIK